MATKQNKTKQNKKHTSLFLRDYTEQATELNNGGATQSVLNRRVKSLQVTGLNQRVAMLIMMAKLPQRGNPQENPFKLKDIWVFIFRSLSKRSVWV